MNGRWASLLNQAAGPATGLLSLSAVKALEHVLSQDSVEALNSLREEASLHHTPLLFSVVVSPGRARAPSPVVGLEELPSEKHSVQCPLREDGGGSGMGAQVLSHRAGPRITSTWPVCLPPETAGGNAVSGPTCAAGLP